MLTHPAAELFPLMGDRELAELGHDIRERGLLEPIVLLDGAVLDGRNRARACALVGVPVRTVEWDGRGDPAPWVISKNLRRRHLDESQRGMVAARLKDYFAAGARERQEASRARPGERADARAQICADAPAKAADEAARALNVSPRTVEHAAKVLREGVPAVVDAVQRGALAVSVASEAAGLPAPRQDALVERIAAAATPQEARKVAREVLKEERDAKREERDARRVADLEARAATVVDAPASGADLRRADVLEVARSLRGVGLVHADPPWSYRNEGVNGSAGGHYATDTMSGIVAALEAAWDAADDPCYLLLWATFPTLAEWFAVSARVRWRYVTGGAWGKLGRLGSGFHWRGDAEVLLVYAKGAPRPFGDTLSNFHASERTGHSEKPEEWLRRCVEHFGVPGRPVLDLWAGMAPLARACLAVGRPYVGAELDEARHREAVARLTLTREVA